MCLDELLDWAGGEEGRTPGQRVEEGGGRTQDWGGVEGGGLKYKIFFTSPCIIL